MKRFKDLNALSIVCCDAFKGLIVAMLTAVLFSQCSIDNTLNWHEQNGYRWAELNFRRSGKVGFSLLQPEKTKITFQNDLTKEQIVSNHVLPNGSGVAIGDIDHDGLNDIYFCRLNGPNVLYKNLGKWEFQDITEQAGVACPDQFSSGAAFADIDGDNDLDLLVTSIGGKNFCFFNDGTGKFADVSEESGIKSGTGSTTLALADIDGDGDLDLYVVNYKALRAANIFMPQELSFDNLIERNEVDGSYRIREKYKEHYDLVRVDNFLLWEERGEPDVLYLNDGKGHFNEVSFTNGTFLDENSKPVKELYDWGLAAKFQDINNDGYPDLYVCNDFNSPDRIWINDGAGHFQAIFRQAIRHTSHSSMAVDFSDLERDGDVDFLVLDMLGMSHQRRKMQFNTMPPTKYKIGDLDDRPQYMRNTMFVNRGDNTFAEIGRLSGVHASDWSWAVSFLDVDLDGFEDILVATGQIHDTQNVDTRAQMVNRSMTGMINSPATILKYPRLELANVAFKNNGDLTFENVTEKWGFGNTPDIGHGMALGDLDNDGDVDVVINRFQMPAAVYRNNASQNRIAVKLQGKSPNTLGIGAKIQVSGGPVLQAKEVSLGGTYLSGSAPAYTFAAGENTNIAIEVVWRSGMKSVIKDARQNRIYEIGEESATNASQPESAAAKKLQPYFKDASNLLRHLHHEEFFHDAARQPLLSMNLSQLGPGAAFLDIDNDSDDDVVIASGKGGMLTVIENRNGTWRKLGGRFLAKTIDMDQTTVLGWAEKGKYNLFVGHSNDENRMQESFVAKYSLVNGKIASVDTLALGDVSVGALAAADYDHDGDLDLFVGGRSLPGKYPLPPPSFFFNNENGNFTRDENNKMNWDSVGMVSSAVFSDIDGDGDSDLVLAVQWGPVTILRNNNGLFEIATEDYGLHRYHGLWNGIATGDLNGDGRIDIVATNWGSNTRYHVESGHPIRMYYQDFDLNGVVDIIEAYHDPTIDKYVPFSGFERMMQGIPFTRVRVPSFKKYARIGLEDIFGQKLNDAKICSLTTIEHTLFLSNDSGYQAQPLPVEAQFAPAFYAGIADFDGDGHEDVFLTQNFFGALPEDGKDDAGPGLWLRGDGKGNLKIVPSQVSGVAIYGEQRGAALGDFNDDARVDLLVTQNGAGTKLYENVRAKPGVTIRLHGNAMNVNAIGARVQLKYHGGYGPVREIQSGSGYGSQNSSSVTMGKKDRVIGVRVFWPGGDEREYKLPENAKNVSIKYTGEATVEQIY